MTFDFDIRQASPSLCYLGQGGRTRSEVTVQGHRSHYSAMRHVMRCRVHSESPDDSIKLKHNTVDCRVICAKVVAATSSGAF